MAQVARASMAVRRRLRMTQQRVQKTAKLGSGARFRVLERSIAAGGARDPGAVAAAIGRKKFGQKRFRALATAGRRRA